MILLVTLTVILGYFIWTVARGSPTPRCGVYRLPGQFYRLKKALIFIVIILLRQWKRMKRKSSLQETYNLFQTSDPPASMGQNKEALDSVCFRGFSVDGSSLICRVGRGHDRQAEVWLTMTIPGLGTYQHPIHPDTALCNTDGVSFSAGGLSMEVVEPLKTWRVAFNGILRKGIKTDLTEEKYDYVHVKFNFIWRSFSTPFNPSMDLHPNCLSDAIAREPWTEDIWHRLNQHFQTQHQWGEMRGRVEVAGKEEITLTLKTLKERYYGVNYFRKLHRSLTHSIYLETGTVVHVGVISSPKLLTHMMTGYISYGSGVTVPISHVTLEMAEVGEHTLPPDSYTFSFTADGVGYLVEVLTHTSALFYHYDDRGSKVYQKFSTFFVNRKKGWGVAEFLYRNSKGPSVVNPERSVPCVERLGAEDIKGRQSQLTLAFSDLSSCRSDLVGGKGAQLAQLTTLEKTVGFKVPKGFCLTLAAFEEQLEGSPGLRDSLNSLKGYERTHSMEDLKTICSSIMDSFTKSEIVPKVREAIIREVTHIWGNNLEKISLAVRSSAAGEDGVESSTAGQLDTYLGLTNIKQVLECVVKCWASGFTFQAEQYRRQQGQEMVMFVGVVIQEMISPDTAGVLFTKDPLTNNPCEMIINANYGVGESVVSGVTDADTIRLARTWDNHLTIHSKLIGQKSTLIKLADGGGIESVNVGDHMTTDCCLTDETILLIGQIGLELEKYYGSARDVEWAVKDGQLYLLQARPVTSEEMETEYDLIHEFDTAMSSDTVWLTTGNIGEMMPGAVTPLTFSVFSEAVDKGLQGFLQDCGCLPITPHALKSVVAFCNHLFINLHHIGVTYLNIMIANRPMMDISLLGEVLTDLSVSSVAEYHRCHGTLSRLWNSIKMIQCQRRGTNLCYQWEKRLMDYCSSTSGNSTGIYDDINKQLLDYYEVFKETMIVSSKSGSWSLVLLSILNGGKPEVSNAHFADLAILLANCSDVISVDVPHLLQGLAADIQKSGLRDHFISLTCQEATAWLLSPLSGTAGQLFTDFLNTHGHRCIKESEMFEKSWSQEPSKLTQILQSMLKAEIQLRKIQSNSKGKDVIRELSTPVSWIGRLLLRALLPKAWAAVGLREWAKSLSIKMSNVVKESYWSLANCMVIEGRLPDENLLFFLTHYEIGRLIETRSPRIINKAIRRRRVFPKQMALDFPKYSIGHAQPLPEAGEEEHEITCISLTGMPVSQGEITGRACVMKKVEDADHLQAGDVLIVPYTDVGWSPYFPLISGLVTEIGGLLSHGAVVAREYGLPCVVNVAKATTIFKTGDQIHLNGSLGKVEKLEG